MMRLDYANKVILKIHLRKSVIWGCMQFMYSVNTFNFNALPTSHVQN